MILVIDDDPEVHGQIEDALRPRGYRVEGATDGREGLFRVKEQVPQLIVLDYWAPTLDGAAFMRALARLLERRPPVILLTASEDDPRLARELGVDVYVEKPVDPERFARLVDATVRAARPKAKAPRAQGSERRVYPRYSVHRPVEVRRGGRRGVLAGFTVDISDGGMCLDMGRVLEPDAYLSIACVLDDGQRVELDARVRHASTSGKVGVQFFALDDRKRRAIAALAAQA